MPAYSVKTLSEEGLLEASVMNAASRKALEKALEKEGKILTGVRERKETKTAKPVSGKIKSADLTDFLIYLSITSSSGIPVTTALEDFIKRTRAGTLRQILSNILENVTKGMRLSDSIEEYKGFFGTIFVHVVKAGEETGSLDVVLDRYREQMEWQTKIKGSMRQALIYPCFLILAVTGLVILLITFLLPRIMGIYADSDIELPVITRILIASSDFLRGNWQPLVSVAVGVPLTITMVKRFKRGRILLDRMVFRIPVFGTIVADIVLARFTVIFKTLLSSGVEIVKAIEISGSSSGNSYIGMLAEKAIEDVRNGNKLSTAFVAFNEMNLLLPRMVSIGEKTGRIVDTMECAYNYFDKTIPNKVNRMISMLEPSIIIIAGLLVGFILLGALMPIYSMYSGM